MNFENQSVAGEVKGKSRATHRQCSSLIFWMLHGKRMAWVEDDIAKIVW